MNIISQRLYFLCLSNNFRFSFCLRYFITLKRTTALIGFYDELNELHNLGKTYELFELVNLKMH